MEQRTLLRLAPSVSIQTLSAGPLVLAQAPSSTPGFVRRFNASVTDVVQPLDRMQREETIGANLRFVNDPANILRAHQPYADMARRRRRHLYRGTGGVGPVRAESRHLGDFGPNHPARGPGTAHYWIGMGHALILRELMRSHPTRRLVEPLDYLQ